MLAAGGCSLTVNPFRDPMAGRMEVTTASADGARAAGGVASDVRRPFPATAVALQAQTVQHYPAYYEDTMHARWSEDESFVWTWADYAQIFAWNGRFLADTVTLPVQAVFMPPWSVMESDGLVSSECMGTYYDAARTRTR